MANGRSSRALAHSGRLDTLGAQGFESRAGGFLGAVGAQRYGQLVGSAGLDDEEILDPELLQFRRLLAHFLLVGQRRDEDPVATVLRHRAARRLEVRELFAQQALDLVSLGAGQISSRLTASALLPVGRLFPLPAPVRTWRLASRNDLHLLG
jgi:hypothetical protein